MPSFLPLRCCALFRSFGERLTAGFCRGITQLSVSGDIPSLKPVPRIYYANHNSHMDGLVLWTALPSPLRSRLRPVAASDYWRKNAFRRFIATHISNVVLIYRCGERPLGEDLLSPLVDAVNQGDSLIFFPEGTRGINGKTGHFQGGLYQLLKRCPEAECIPVYLKNVHRLLPKGQYWIRPTKCSVTFGRPLLPPQQGEDKHTFLRRAREALESLADSF